MKKLSVIVFLSLLWNNITYGNVKNIGNGLNINIPDGYHYFDLTLKQFVSRFPSTDVSKFTNSDLGIGMDAKLVILANNKKTIKLFDDISSVEGFTRLTKNYLEPFNKLMSEDEFIKIIENYLKKNFPNVDLNKASEEELIKALSTMLEDKIFLKKIDKYTRPFIDRFNSDYEFDKITIIFIADKKFKRIDELKKLSISEAEDFTKELIKKAIKEDPYYGIYNNLKYEIKKNSKGNLYLYSNDIDYLDKDPLFKKINLITMSDIFITIENEKIFIINSLCYKKCNSTDFLQTIEPTNLFK